MRQPHQVGAGSATAGTPASETRRRPARPAAGASSPSSACCGVLTFQFGDLDFLQRPRERMARADQFQEGARGLAFSATK